MTVIALDTDILVRLANPADPTHPVAPGAVAKLSTAGEPLCISPQNIYEFWSTGTRPLSARGAGAPRSRLLG